MNKLEQLKDKLLMADEFGSLKTTVMKTYTESEMIAFALHYAIAIVNAGMDDKHQPLAEIELENWKNKTY